MSKAVLSTSNPLSPVPYLMASVFLISALQVQIHTRIKYTSFIIMADCQEQGDLSSKISGWQIDSIGSKLAGHQNKDASHNLRCWGNPPRDSHAAMYDKYHIIGFLFLHLPMHRSVLSSSENFFGGRTLCQHHSKQIFPAFQKQMRILAENVRIIQDGMDLWRLPMLTRS